MIVYILYFTLLGSAVVFINLNHPIRLGLALIVHTLLVSAATGLVGGHFWFSYILFLVFLGGVLVLFIYITSLASNEKFSFDWTGLLIVLLTIAIVLVGALIGFLPSPETTASVIDLTPYSIGLMSLGILVIKLYSIECFKITALLVLYLLYALLVCARIVNKYSGALRNFN